MQSGGRRQPQPWQYESFRDEWLSHLLVSALRLLREPTQDSITSPSRPILATVD